MTIDKRGAGALAPAIILLALSGCASLRYARMDVPEGPRALGLQFGLDRDGTARALRDAGIASRPAPSDADALLADRCPGAPVKAPCRLLIGPQGLYAAQVEVSVSEAATLTDSVRSSLGRPDRTGDGAVAEGAPVLVAGWDRRGWTVSVTRGGAGASTALAVLRVEYDPAAPPVVAGVPLGRLREDVEHALDVQGATLVQRDDGTTTYLGCPQGAGEALSCVVLFRAGRAAAVTEIHPAAPDDPAAMASWKILARRFEKDIGRPPETSCPDSGPDRVGGDCTATWASDRLVVVVGAHRNAGHEHRGAISVYTAFTYPPLAVKASEEEAEAQ